jgi:TQXA domain-containing protein
MKQCISTSALLTSFFIFIALIFMMPMSAQAANTSGDYVGYYDSKIKASDGVELYSLYVTPKSNYVSGKGLTNPNNKEVAYCFNKQSKWPRNNTSGWWVDKLNENSPEYKVETGLVLYNQLPDVKGSILSTYAKKSSITNADEFRAKIVSIGLNGYPYDYSGINKDTNGKQILSDDVFRAITQYAIWYYTDSDYDESVRGWSDAEKTVFRDLVDATLPKEITDIAISAIDLYIWDGNASFDSATATVYKDNSTTPETGGSYSDPYAALNGYQNLLAIRTSSLSTIKNLSTPMTLTLSKATTGNLDGTFTFDINLGTGAIYWVNEETAENVTDHRNGKVTVTLKNGESVALKIAGTSFDYSIEETNASAYKTSISVKKGKGTVSTTNSKLISGTNVTGDTAILYTNTGTNESSYDDDDDDYYYDEDDYVSENYKLVNTVPSKNSTTDLLKETENPTGDGAEAADDSGFLDVAAAMPSPKTADSSNLVLWFGLMAICVAAGVLILRRKIK